MPLNGEEIRRSYSICSSPFENELRIAVKKIGEGKFSGHANTKLRVGDTIEVMPPSGRFILVPDNTRSANYLAFAAGSGITPVISIIKNTLANEPGSRFMLVYGNRHRGTIIFKEELDALKNRFIDRLVVHHILSREETDVPIHYGRIDEEKCELLSKYLFRLEDIDHFFMCGPERMIFTVRDWLQKKGVAPSRIHFELFNVPGERVANIHAEKNNVAGNSHVRLKLDGLWMSFDMPYEGMSVLDEALKYGADLPYSCKGGVCATCRAKLLSGEVNMSSNYALEQEEIDAGYILTCQSHPRSGNVVIDFDARG